MNDSLDELKKGYRSIEAPAHLATRIRAEVADKPLRSHSWLPAGATLMAVVVVAWFAPYLGEQSTEPAARPSKPSLSAIASLKPDAPARTSASLSKLKTVKRPKLPAKPRLPSAKPQSNLEMERDLFEEKDYEFI